MTLNDRREYVYFVTTYNLRVEMDCHIRNLRSVHPARDAIDALQTVLTIENNKWARPSEERVHRIRLANERFFRSVGRMAAGRAMMQTLGFEESTCGMWLQANPGPDEFHTDRFHRAVSEVINRHLHELRDEVEDEGIL